MLGVEHRITAARTAVKEGLDWQRLKASDHTLTVSVVQRREER